jgi:hypothetical protein
MRGLKVLLFVSFVSGVGYALLLIVIPQQLAKIGAGPNELLWARFLVPLYLGLATANWHAYRDPLKNVAVIQALIVMWSLLALSHIYTGVTGLEAWKTGVPWLLFDGVMAVLLIIFYQKGKRDQPAGTP